MIWLLTAGAGGMGALCRVLILNWCARLQTEFPLGTLTVNVLACFAGGVLAGLDLPEPALLFCFVGFLGGLGTLSSVCSDCINLFVRHCFLKIPLYLALTASLGLAAAALGWHSVTLLLQTGVWGG